MNKFYLKISALIILILALGACDSQNTLSPTAIKLARVKPSITVWDRMANDFRINTQEKNPRVQSFIKQFTRNDAENLIRFSHQANPYLYHIVSILEARNMPSELAILPIVESEYKPFATSNKGASGIWQLASMTGRLYGLKQDKWSDERKDIEAATHVALEHLQYMYEKFDHDWLLALAAYNAGPGRVDQAIRANKRAGKPTDYWSLKLPKETQYFVPKFLALVYLIENHHKLNIKLAPIANKPYFAKVKLTAPIDLNKVASLAKVDIKEVKHLNPACRTNMTHPKGPHHIILPVNNVSVFKENFAAKPAVAITPVKKKPAATTIAKPTSSTGAKTKPRPKAKAAPKPAGPKTKKA